MKRLVLFPLPIAIIVYLMANGWLNKYYTDIEPNIRTYIAIGAALVSGVISYFLFKDDSDKFNSADDSRKK
ncbi:histidine kinase [Siminovitchia fortis]|uniref:Histidine kinase n=1 Tax=Siminovitchia fortis TaxID=254758 RepID=A0A443IKM7_9BACI|nr:histidine kinase [Siminovitchia fortis]RWR05189.1 histidine kinase [Siminovitchia fortis]WHY82407.1 histidine kinase [Siminovitchia fortis]